MIRSEDYEDFRWGGVPIGQPMNPDLDYPLAGPVDYDHEQDIRVIDIQGSAVLRRIRDENLRIKGLSEEEFNREFLSHFKPQPAILLSAVRSLH